ncbi:hypothetical protein NDS46_15040 [Paenibacillus thiaminolyticus]|uniref:hypothetical protein n=1 Tax=Paenibacillus thiaminolyticus TaxID=49283 RepID=UPI00232E1AA4|nr:hypothetical protein [Paenibacillus thiaminolyticus]WCF05711.1 hypothetical protein NDS46_15040 [Paenibacillus thiaminolyticus]
MAPRRSSKTPHDAAGRLHAAGRCGLQDAARRVKTVPALQAKTPNRVSSCFNGPIRTSR